MKKQKLYTGILLSYIVIMLTPMIILGGVLFNFFYRTYSNELIHNRYSSLKKFQIIMDTIVNDMNANAHIMYNSSNFTTQYLQDAYGNFYSVLRKLSDVTFTNRMIDGVYYINSGMQRVYAPLTSYSYADFTTYSSGYAVASSKMESLLLKGRGSYWIPTQPVGPDKIPVLSYVVPGRPGSGTVSESSIFFQIRQDKLDQLVGEFNDPNSCTILTGPGGELLYTSNPQISDTGWQTWQLYEGPKSEQPIQLNIDGKDYVFIQADSQESSLSYLSIIPYQNLIAPIEAHRTLFLGGVILITVLCSIFIFHFMKVNYKPFLTINRLVSSLFRSSTGQEEADLRDTEQVLTQINESHSRLLRDQITLRLMRGGYHTLQELERDGEPVGYQLSGPLFRAINFRIEQSEEALDIGKYEELSKFIEDNIRVYADASAVNYSEDNSIFLVLSGLDEEMRGLSEKYRQIKNVIENAFSLTLSVGVGNVVTVDMVLESVSQATKACNFNFMKGRGSITFYHELEQDKDPFSQFVYPTRAIDALHHAILQGEGERVQFAMETLVKNIQDTHSLFYGTCLAYDILNTAMKAMRELNYSFSSFGEQDLSSKGALRSVDEIVDIVNHITRQIVEIISERSPAGGEESAVPLPISNFEQIMRYIREHYCEENFSIKSLAENFGMSISNFSHYFKKQTGQTVSEYVALLRFERAKTLLRTTDMNLQDISSMCGYLHLSTFMRQFKQRENRTPASYRSQYRH